MTFLLVPATCALNSGHSAGVEEVKVDAGAGKVTVKGFGFDVEKLRAKVEKGCRKKVELVVPAKKDDVVIEVKTKKEV